MLDVACFPAAPAPRCLPSPDESAFVLELPLHEVGDEPIGIVADVDLQHLDDLPQPVQRAPPVDVRESARCAVL